MKDKSYLNYSLLTSDFPSILFWYKWLVKSQKINQTRKIGVKFAFFKDF